MRFPPFLDDRMPEWDVNQVLRWLLSKEFCPPEEASFLRLEQKTFFLIMIGAGRRAHEICNLSLDYKRKGESSCFGLLRSEPKTTMRSILLLVLQ